MSSRSVFPKTFSLLLAALLSPLGCGPAPQTPTEVPASASNTWPDPTPLRPDTVPLSELMRDNVTVVDLWATWCEPCRESIPKVIRLADAFRDAGLVVAGVHVGVHEQADTFAREVGISYPLYVDEQLLLAHALKSDRVPTILVFDRSGQVVFRGDDLDADVLATVRRLLE